MSRALLSLALCLPTAFAVAQPAAADRSIDSRLLNICNARTDARMESMTLRKLEQIRNFEFSLRIAVAQLAAGKTAMSALEWRLATAKVQEARTQLAQVCDVTVPQQG